ncbi:hypothetical protein, partial [Methanococcus maripaludis]
MRYNEIIKLHENFIGHYNLDSEEPDYWKKYVATEKFYEILNKSLDAFTSPKLDDQKSLWIQGVYGSGKSHTMGVIKHLFWDEMSDISTFIDGVILDKSYKNKLERFRDEKRVFPVVIKGKEYMSGSATFSYAIQKAVLKALEKENIPEIVTDSDFHTIIENIKDPKFTSTWDNLFEEELDISSLSPDKEHLISLLEQKDVSTLRTILKVFQKFHISFSAANIMDWLSQVQKKLKENNIADYIMIYWDEFTQVLNIDSNGAFLDDIQQIADASRKSGIYFFIGSHKSVEQFGALDSVKKVKDRFNTVDYKMESNTTYQIIRKSYLIKNNEKLEELIRTHYSTPEMRGLISELSGLGASQTMDDLKHIFPIHPYSAYLSTYISRYLTSSSRSIFKYLYGEKNSGFSKFIEDNPGESGDVFITPDHLLDYFIEDFETNLNEGYSQILTKYLNYNSKLFDQGKDYSTVFKTLVLLNLLNKTISVSDASQRNLLAPTTETLQKIFLGTNISENLENILEYIDTEAIIQKTPDGEFFISTSSLPTSEVNNEENNLLSTKKDITSILEPHDHERIIHMLEESKERELSIQIFDVSTKRDVLLSRLNRSFKEPYKIPIAFFVAKNDMELNKFNDNLSEITPKLEKDVIFVISRNPLTEKEYSRIISYEARSIVAKNHGLKEDYTTNWGFKKKAVNAWIDGIKSGTSIVVLKNKKEGNVLTNNLYDTIKSFSQLIFYNGLENLPHIKHRVAIWKESLAKKPVEHTCHSKDQKDFINKCTGAFKDLPDAFIAKNNEYVVDSELVLTEDADLDHPIVALNSKIDEILKNKKHSFHLGDALKFLKEPPFGIYKNSINMFAVAFVFRKYINKLYDAKTSDVLGPQEMYYKIVGVFEYLDGKTPNVELDVIFGSEEEEKLKTLLESIFRLKSDEDGPKNTRWKVRHWIRDSGYPLWVYSSEKGIDQAITAIMEYIDITDEKQISAGQISKIYHDIDQSSSDLRIKLSSEASKKLFIEWLKKQDSHYVENEFNDIVQYLGEHLHENLETWSENEVSSKLKDRRILKLAEDSKLPPAETV